MERKEFNALCRKVGRMIREEAKPSEIISAVMQTSSAQLDEVVQLKAKVEGLTNKLAAKKEESVFSNMILHVGEQILRFGIENQREPRFCFVPEEIKGRIDEECAGAFDWRRARICGVPVYVAGKLPGIMVG